MKIDTKKIAKNVINQIDVSDTDKTKTSLYLSKTTYKAFKKACSNSGVSPSRALEMLMQGFVDASKGIQKYA